MKCFSKCNLLECNDHKLGTNKFSESYWEIRLTLLGFPYAAMEAKNGSTIKHMAKTSSRCR